MYCAYCGKQIANNSVYCGYCGKPVPRSDTFAELVAAARTGSQDAVSTLYEKTYSKAYYTVKSMIKDEDAVLDIVQDAYIKAFAHLDSFQGDTKFLPWVRQIAANTARDWLKKKRPMLFTEMGSGDEQDTPVEELFPDERSENLPDQIIDQKETKRLLREIIEDLPEDQRAAIGMFYYEEMSVKEIAAAMDVTESAVKSRLMYGRNKIEKKVRELEKQGTKLYSLSPLPFLLLLFRNLDTYATQAPDGRILHSLLALQPVKAVAAGAAQGVSTAGAATGAEAAGVAQGAGTAGAVTGAEAAGVAQGAGTVGTAAGSAAAGTAQGAGMAEAASGSAAAGTAGAGAAAGGLGALKIGLIALASVAVVGLGTFGAIQIASRDAEPQETSAVEDDTEREESEGWEESEGREESRVREESEEPEKPDPVDEALEQYRSIISQADSYEYGDDDMLNQSWFELSGYRYALVQMQPDDKVPTLLLERVIMDIERNAPSCTALVFQYDPDTKIVCQPAERMGDGGIRGGLSMAGDGYGIFDLYWSGGTGEGSVIRYTLDGDSLNHETYWKGRIDLMPDSITFIEIEWHEIEDLTALDSWTAPDSGEGDPSGSAGSDTLPADGDRIVLTGTVGTYDYDEIVELQGEPDPYIPYDESQIESYLERMRSITYHVIILDTPQTLRLPSGGWSGEGDKYTSHEAWMILLCEDSMYDPSYEGRHITFSIDPDGALWPSEAEVPIGQPRVCDIHILD